LFLYCVRQTFSLASSFLLITFWLLLHKYGASVMSCGMYHVAEDGTDSNK